MKQNEAFEGWEFSLDDKGIKFIYINAENIPLSSIDNAYF